MPRTKSARYVKIHSWNGLQRTRPKNPLTQLVGPLYTLKIGYMTLKKLGYGIVFTRRQQKGSACDYSLIRMTPAVKDLYADIRPTHSHGIASSTPRVKGKYNLNLKLLLLQISRNATNLDLRRYEYRLVAVFLLDNEGITLDIDTIKLPKYSVPHIDLISYPRGTIQ